MTWRSMLPFPTNEGMSEAAVKFENIDAHWILDGGKKGKAPDSGQLTRKG